MKGDTFNSYSHYYDLLYRDKDYVAEANYVVSLLDRFGAAGKDVLEFGTGTGKHGRLLAENGYTVTGIERSAEMVSNTTIVPGFICKQGNICDVHMGRTYDAVLSLFHVVSYLTTNEEVQALFARASEHLLAGGLFIFDVWYSPAVYAQKPEVRVKRISDDTIELTRIAEPELHPNANRVDVHYSLFVREMLSGSVKTFSEIHSMRHFSIPELELVARINGFEVISYEEFLTGNAASEDSWGVCFILKKVA